MVKVKQVCLDFAFQSRTHLLVPHVSVHNTNPMLNLKLFVIQLLNDAPNLVQTVRINKATNKLHCNSVRNFVSILRSNVTISDRNHCG